MASVDELWLVDFGEPQPGEPASVRPALVLGPPDYFGADFPFTIVAPLTTAERRISLHVEIDATEETGLDDTSYIQCELLRSVHQRRLLHRLGRPPLEVSQRAHDTVRILLGH